MNPRTAFGNQQSGGIACDAPMVARANNSVASLLDCAGANMVRSHDILDKILDGVLNEPKAACEKQLEQPSDLMTIAERQNASAFSLASKLDKLAAILLVR